MKTFLYGNRHSITYMAQTEAEDEKKPYDTVGVNIRMPYHLRSKLDQVSDDTGLNRSQVINRLLEHDLRNDKHKEVFEHY